MISISPKHRKRLDILLWMLTDLFFVNASIAISLIVWRVRDASSNSLWNGFSLSPLLSVMYWIVLVLGGVYTTIWRYASIRDMVRIAVCTAVAAGLSFVSSLLMKKNPAFVSLNTEWQVFLLIGLFSMVFLCGTRLFYHSISRRERTLLLKEENAKQRAVMIIGGGWFGADLVHDIQNGHYGNCVPIVVVDDDLTRTGGQISGVPVEKGTGNILRLASEYQADDIFIAIATPKGDISHIIEKCVATGCRVRRVYPPQEVRSTTMNQAPYRQPGEETPQTHEAFMKEALLQAAEAAAEGEIPVGAVLVHEGKIIARAHNARENGTDPTAHAEILVLREGARILGRRRLDGCTLYVTLEPCPMCAGAMIMSNLSKCYFGAKDERQGCAESVYALTQDPAFYHQVTCVGGLCETEAAALLKDFFSKRREEGGDGHEDLHNSQ